MSDDVRPGQDDRTGDGAGATVPHPPRSFWARPLPGEQAVPQSAAPVTEAAPVAPGHPPAPAAPVTEAQPVAAAPQVPPVTLAPPQPVAGPTVTHGSTVAADLTRPHVTSTPAGATAARPGARRPAGVLRQSVVALAGLAAAWLVTTAMSALLVTGMALHPGLRRAVGSLGAQLGPVDPSASPGAIAATGSQLVAMAVGGRLHGTVSVFTVAAAAWLALPVASVVVVLLATGHLAARARGPVVTRRRDALPGAVVAGLVAALAVVALARLVPFGGGTSVVHAAGLRTLAGGWLLLGLASFTGTVRRSRLALFDGHPLLRETSRALGVLAAFVACFATVAGIGGGLVTLVGAMVRDGAGAALGLLLALPLLAGTLVAMLLALTTGASLQASTGTGGSTAHLGSSTVSLATLSPVLGVVVALALLAATAVAAARWSTRRRILTASGRARAASWLLLPALFGLFGRLLQHSAVDVGARTGMAASTSVHYGPTAWTPFGLALVGLVVELIARLAGGRLASLLPSRVVAAPAGSVAPVHTTAPGTTTAAVPDGPGALALAAPVVMPPSPAEGSGASAPTVRRPRRHLLAGLVAALLVALLVAGAGLVRQVRATSASPEAQARAVMDALVAADVDRLQQLVPSSRHMGPLVATDVYRAATARPAAYRVTEVATAGDHATVSTVVTMGGQDVPLDLDVRRTGRRFGVLEDWQVSRLPLVDVVLGVPAGTTTIVANGRTVPVMAGASSRGGQAVSLPALPGTYSLALPPAGPLVTPVAVQHQVLPMASPSRDELAYQPTAALQEKVDIAVRQLLEACARRTGAAPAGCPWSVGITNATPTATVTWTLSDPGDWQLLPTGTPSLFQVRGTRPGMAVATLRSAPGAPVADTAQVAFRVDGTATVTSGGQVTATLR